MGETGRTPPMGRLGRYVIERPLGRGGMAEVYLARAEGPEGFRRRVALKVIRKEYTEAKDWVRMFQDEARTAAHFTHPNIVQIYDFGCISGRYYLAMEYAEGESLEHILRRLKEKGRRLPDAVAAAVGIEAAGGLAYAHAATDDAGRPLGVVHRDLSPDNLLLTPEGYVKILDFGIAKASGREQRTQTGMIKGKPAYMSPEQARGEALDGRSDVFSLGAVLWEALAGERLYTAEGLAALIGKVAYEPPRHLATVAPTVDAALAEVVMSLLERDRDQRPSASEAQAALRNVLRVLGGGTPQEILARWNAGGMEAPPIGGAPTHDPFLTPPPADPFPAPSAGSEQRRAPSLLPSTPPPAAAGPAMAGGGPHGRATEAVRQSAPSPAGPAPAGGGIAPPPLGPPRAPTAAEAPEGGADDGPLELAVDPATLRAPAPERPQAGGTPTPTPPPASATPKERLPRWLPAAGIALGVLLVVAGLAFALIPGGEAAEEEATQQAGGLIRLSVRSTPAGAKIEVDGVETGQRTPAMVEVLDLSNHRIRLTKAGYGPVVAVVPRERVADGVDLTLPPLTSVEVAGTVPASIYCDGELVLTEAPGAFQIPAGEHTLRAEAEGYLPYEERVFVPSAGLTWEPRLEQSAYLQVSSRPAGARIFVDGKATHRVTPAKIEVAPREKAAVRLEHGVLSAETTVRAPPPGKTRRVKLVLRDELARLLKQRERLNARLLSVDRRLAELGDRIDQSILDGKDLWRLQREQQALEEEFDHLNEVRYELDARIDELKARRGLE